MSAIISMFLGMDDLYQITYDREAVIELFKNSDDDYILDQVLDYISK